MADLFSLSDLIDHLRKLPPEQLQQVIAGVSEETEKNRIIKEEGLLKNGNGDIISCLNCGSTSVHIHTKSEKSIRYACKECHKTFTETANTFFKNSHLTELQWRELIRGMIENQSITQIALNTDLGNKAVWYNKSKILDLIAKQCGNEDHFKNISECDETFVHLSFKGKRDAEFFIRFLKRMPRHHRSKAEKIKYLQDNGLYTQLETQEPEFLEYLLSATKRSETSLPGTNEDSVCVMAVRDRDNNSFIAPTCVGSLDQKNVETSLDGRIEEKSILVTDGNTTYNWFADERSIFHIVINSETHKAVPAATTTPKKPATAGDVFSLGHVNSYHSNYKSYYSEDRKSLPATKYLDLGTHFFWWLEKYRGKSANEKVDIIYNLMKEAETAITYEELRHRKLTLDTKGLIPERV